MAGLSGTAATAATADSSISRDDPGIGSPEALANPNCDPTTKRVKYQTYAAPLCVKPWKAGADNGGATGPGVTNDTIKVVVLCGDAAIADPASRGLYVNQATGQNDPNGCIDGTKDANEIYQHISETWGRKVNLQFLKTGGADEAAQRADAVTVAAMKPFAVLDAASQLNTPPAGGGAC